LYGSRVMTCYTSRSNGAIPPFGSLLLMIPPRRTSHASK
jgi:hypothetical protein